MIKISIIIPTYNRLEILKKTLAALNKQTVPFNQFETIVIDDGSSDRSAFKLRKIKSSFNYPLTILRHKNQGPAFARNKGIKKAKSKIVLIMDDDAIPTPNLVARHLSFHQKHRQNNFALLGFVTWDKNMKITPFMRWLEHGGPMFSFHTIKNGNATWQRLWTCNISFKKKFLTDAGLFDTSFPNPAWEDIEFGYRLHKKGLKLLFDKQAAAFHYHPGMSLKAIKNKMLNNGRNVLLLKNKLPRRHLPPLAKQPRLAIFLDSLILNPLVFFPLEKLAQFLENKVILACLFDLVLLHYRIQGLRQYVTIKNRW